jgi:hypothetical protein
MSSVTRDQLSTRIVQLLGLKPGEPFELALTRDGHVIVGRTQP